MKEEIIKVVEEKTIGSMTVQIVETKYGYGTHYVLVVNGKPGFHSIDLDRVEDYMNFWVNIMEKT